MLPPWFEGLVVSMRCGGPIIPLRPEGFTVPGLRKDEFVVSCPWYGGRIVLPCPDAVVVLGGCVPGLTASLPLLRSKTFNNNRIVLPFIRGCAARRWWNHPLLRNCPIVCWGSHVPVVSCTITSRNIPALFHV